MTDDISGRAICLDVVVESGARGVTNRECAERAGYSASWTYECLQDLVRKGKIKRIETTAPKRVYYFSVSAPIERRPNAVELALIAFGPKGGTAREIADALGLKYGTVYKRLKRLITIGKAIKTGKQKKTRYYCV